MYIDVLDKIRFIYFLYLKLKLCKKKNYKKYLFVFNVLCYILRFSYVVYIVLLFTLDLKVKVVFLVKSAYLKPYMCFLT